MPAKMPTLHQPDHPRPSHRGTMLGTAMRPKARTMITTTTPCTQMCCNCVVVGQMPVCDAGGNANAMRAKRPAQREQQRQFNAGNDNSAMLARMPAQRGQRCQRNAGKTASARLARHEGQVARERRQLQQQKPQTTTMSLVTTPHTLTFHDCVVMGQMPVRNADGNTGATRVTSPARRGQRCPRNKGRMRNAGEDNSVVLVIPPAGCGQGRQRNANNDTSAALAGPLETKFLGNNAQYGDNAMGYNKAQQGCHVY
jgi:hypothetical protein